MIGQPNQSILMKSTYWLLSVMVIICSFVSSSYGQSLYPVSLDRKIQSSSLIVEGKVVSKQSFWNAGHTMIFTNNKIEIYKVFKGTLEKEYVEVMTQGGTVGGESYTASDLLNLSNNETGVFFCTPNKVNARSPETGDMLLDVFGSKQGFLKYDPNNQTASAPFEKHTSITRELYNTLSNKTGQTIVNRKPSFDISAPIANRVFAPSITSFSPASVHAGALLDPTNNVLTINGTGFGTASGSAAVYFDDADDGIGNGYTAVPFDDSLIISWSATQIKLRVPMNAGTGLIAVQDNSGNASFSATNLDVLYAVETVTFPSGGGAIEKELNLMNTNGSGGYTVVYSTSTSGSGKDLNAAQEKATFQRALNTWKEVTGFNVTEGGTTTNQALGDDGINTIMFDNSNTTVPPLPEGVLAVCYYYAGMCPPVSAWQTQKTGFDIVIRNKAYSIDTATIAADSVHFTIGPCPPLADDFHDYDLETVILHELGHALGLGHINDSYEGASFPLNANKVMNFALINSTRRNTPDYSAYQGALYEITPQGNSYSTCGLFASEMTPLSAITESKDNCPGTFPATFTPPNTTVSFDLVHATSNKLVDPAFNQFNCSGTAISITNNAYYAMRSGAAGGILSLSVTGYSTTPAAEASCTMVYGIPVTGVELSVYQVSSCPGGQSFPAPVACRSFTGNGALTDISGLAANTNYLIMVDGVENTKASFNLTFTGASLPLNNVNLAGEPMDNYNMLHWSMDLNSTVLSAGIERSADGVNFEKIGDLNSLVNNKGNFKDGQPYIGNTYYRLIITNVDGSKEYSKVVTLKQQSSFLVSIFPNPAHSLVNIDIRSLRQGRYTAVLRNTLGQAMSQKDILVSGSRSITQIPVSHLAAGIYQIAIYNEKGQVVKAAAVKID